MTAISNFEDMHEDICATAAAKRTAVILLPFHKSQRLDGQFETTAPGFRLVNQKVLHRAPCSVAILIDRGVGGAAQVAPSNVDHKVAVYFFGGPDDREALAYGLRMAEHPGIHLHVIRFLNRNITTTNPDHVGVSVSTEISSEGRLSASPGRDYQFATHGFDQGEERKMDEAALEVIRRGHLGDGSASEEVGFEEVHVFEPFDGVLEAARTRHHDIILVGRSRRPTEFVAEHLTHRHPEYSELGPFGDALMAADVRASVLVFQQYDASLDCGSSKVAAKAAKPASV